jgi:hypothetical protein
MNGAIHQNPISVQDNGDNNNNNNNYINNNNNNNNSPGMIINNYLGTDSKYIIFFLINYEIIIKI